MLLWGTAFPVAACSLLALACSSSSSTPITPYGGGGGGGAGGGGGGAGGGGAGGGGGGGGPADAGNDGGAVDPCADGGAVSWAADIYPQMLPTGHWECATGNCHSSIASSHTAPLIDPTSADSAYHTCVNTQLLNSSVTTDPERTQLYALLSSQAMPPAGSVVVPATQQELTSLASWIACGSPDN